MELRENYLKEDLITIIQFINIKRVNEMLVQYLAYKVDATIIDYLQILKSDATSIDNTYSLNSQEVQKSINLLNTLTDCVFNKLNIADDSYRKEIDEIIDYDKEDRGFVQFLINVVKLSKRNKNLIRVASNFIHLLVRMNVQLFYEDFSYIEIKDTDISQGNFAGCNLDYSKFCNVNISGVNLNGASIVNAKWSHLKTFEQNIIEEKAQIDKLGLIPNSKLVVVFGKTNNTIKVFHFLRRKLIYQINPKQKKKQFAMSNKGVIAIGTDSITLIHANVGKFISSFANLGEKDFYTSLDFSYDGSFLASQNYHNDIRIWKVDCRQLVMSFSDRNVYSLKFHETINQIAVCIGYRNQKIKIYDISQKKQIQKISGIYAEVNDICLTRDYLLIGTYQSEIQVWNSGWQQQPCLNYHIGQVRTIAYQDKLQIMATGSSDNTIIIWDVKNGSKLSLLRGHTKPINNIQFSDDARYLISCSKDKTIRTWDIETAIKTKQGQKQLPNFENFAISDDEKYLLFLTESKQQIYEMQELQLFKCKKNIEILLYLQLSLLSNRYKFFKLSTQILLMLGKTNQIFTYLLKPKQNFEIDQTTANKNIESKIKKILIQQIIQFKSIDLFESIDKNKAWITEQDGIIKFWYKTKLIFKIHLDTQLAMMKVSQSGNLLLTQAYHLQLQLWSVRQRKLLQMLKGHKQVACCAEFTPNEKIVITSSQDSKMIFWDVATGSQIRQIVIDYGHIYSIKIVNKDENSQNCNLYTNSQGYFQVWHLGECNVNSFKPICYKQYLRQGTPLNIDQAILTGSHLTNCQNHNLLPIFEYIKNQYY